MKKINLLLSILFISVLLMSNGSSTAAAEMSKNDLIAALINREFNFSSGVGGWGTSLYIGLDGYFFGVYHDSDMGVSGEGYPNGTLFYCPFEGKFSIPEYIPAGATSIQLTLESIYYHGLEKYGESAESYGEEIRNGVRLVYSTPYGLDGGRTFTLYFPQHLKAYTSEEFRSWAKSTGVSESNYSQDQLGYYALCNDSNQQGFSSHVISNNKSMINTYIIDVSNQVRSTVSFKGKNVYEMSIASREAYRIWDTALNTIWSALRNTGSDQYLLDEETKWIDWKDQSAARESSKFEGGALYPLYYYTALADRTRWRCYDLADYFYN